LRNYPQKDLVLLKELLEIGNIKPVIDKRYPLAKAAEAIRYLEEGYARRKVIITLEPGGDPELGQGETGARTPPLAT
jgi:D-arabinose 1-dehydrogenase-like Zn-dependent alcohol dehydrogenase